MWFVNWVNDNAAFANVTVTFFSLVIVASITMAAACYAWKQQEKEEHARREDYLHVILKDFGNRFETLSKANDCIVAFIKDITTTINASIAVERVYDTNIKLAQIKPTGDYRHFDKYEMLFFRKYRVIGKKALRFRCSGEVVSNVEELRSDLEKIRDAMEALGQQLSLIRMEFRKPSNFFTADQKDKIEELNKLYYDVIDGKTKPESIQHGFDNVSFIYNVDGNATDLKIMLDRAKKLFSGCEKVIKDSKIMTEAVQMSYFKITKGKDVS